MSIDAFFHGSSNETICGRVRPRLLEISPFWFEVVLTASGAVTSSEWYFFSANVVLFSQPYTLQMKGRREPNINVWFPFKYYQK